MLLRMYGPAVRIWCWKAQRVLAGDFFEPELRERGYAGHFWPKPCSPAEQYGFPCDGCALFYRRQRFEAVREVDGAFGRPIAARVFVLSAPCCVFVEFVYFPPLPHACMACTGKPFTDAAGGSSKQGSLQVPPPRYLPV